MRNLFSRKGSILVYTLLLLSIMLVAALSLATTAIIGKRGALDTDKSMQAFQTADSGAEIILAKIKNAPDSSKFLSDLGTCLNGKITGDFRGKYTISLFGTNPDGSEKALACGDKISDVTKIKSSGSFGETTRAIETAVAAGGEFAVSCADLGGRGPLCIRMDVNTGKTECRALNYSGAGGASTPAVGLGPCPVPWGSDASSNGPYSISCEWSGGARNVTTCVRIDKNGHSETRFLELDDTEFKTSTPSGAGGMW